MKSLKASRDDTVFLRFLAILLVLNSHLDAYYPIPYVGTGGSIGNSLFFMLSSFGLFLSEKENPNSLPGYYEKRILRIFPSVWIVIVLLLLPIQVYTSKIGGYNLLSFLGNFFYPPFWFVQALMCFYLIGYFIMRNYSDRKTALFAAALMAIYGLFYVSFIDLSVFSVETLPIDQFFYLGVFTFGIFLGSRNDEIKYGGIGDFILAFLILLAIYGHKFLMLKGFCCQFQFIQQFMIFPLLVFLLRLSRSPLITDEVMNLPVLSQVIRWIGASTLEIYIVHTVLSELKIYRMHTFPVNVFVFLLCTFTIVFIVNQLSRRFAVLLISRELS